MDPIPESPSYPQPQPEPAPMKKGGINPWMIISIVLFIALIAGGAYIFGKYQAQRQQPYIYGGITPSPVVSVAQVAPAAATPEAMKAGTGTATGTLCYPASLVPAGTIYAKDITTNKETTLAYAGTSAGAGTTYSMPLPVGTYHMKFVPTQYSTVVGYYTEYSTCVGNPSEPGCSGQKARAILPVTISSGQTTDKVNLCDYYYPEGNPPQY